MSPFGIKPPKVGRYERNPIKSLVAAHCNPSYAVAYIKAYTICTLHLLRTLGLCFKCKTAEWWDLLKRTSFHPTI
jgi:hypothetical protein